MAANFLSKELNVKISIEGLHVVPFSSLHLQSLYVSDQEGDTLLYAPEMRASFDLTKVLQGQATIYDVELKKSQFNLSVDRQGRNNLRFLIDYFSPEDKDSPRKIKLELERIRLEGAAFTYKNQQRQTHNLVNTIDFADLFVTDINGILSDIQFEGPQVRALINDFSLQERSGFQIQHLEARAMLDNQHIELRDLDLQTNQSRIQPYVLLSFEEFSDFDDFINQVDIQLELESSRINSADIAYFAPDVTDVIFDTDISGSLSGRVNAISGKNISLIPADNTQLLGDLSIVGLPEIETTVFDIQLQKLQSNTADIEQLVFELSPNPDFDLPDFLDNLETLEYKGTFKGFYNNFTLEGQLQSALGSLETGLDIEFLEGPVRYSGDLITEEFDLGTFVGQPLLGHIAWSTWVKGENFQLNTIQLETEGLVDYVDFNNYRYQGISLIAGLDGELLLADIIVDDPNLQMAANGQLSLSRDSIFHDFDATIQQADLTALQLYSHKPLIIKNTRINSHLTGSNLNDIKGTTAVHDLQLDLDGRTFHIPATELVANGDSHNRDLMLRSDILEAQLSGQVDLNGIWPYFKDMAQQYIPSLELSPEDSGSQNFQLTVQVYDFAPIAAFIPNPIQVSSGSTFDGRFASSDNNTGTAAFKAYIPEFEIGPIHARQIHISQNTGGLNAPLTLDLSADAVQLYNTQQIATIEIHQKLQNNRLDYQIHMQDTSSLHRAKLAGQLLFANRNSLSIQTSASEIILNEVIWQVSESQIRIVDGQTSVQGLEFSNQQQRIHINGLISNQPNDQLYVSFNNFDLSTLSPFIPNINFRLGGRINGQADISSVLNKPYAVADLSIRDITMDNLLVGNMDIDANFDQERNLVNLAIDLSKQNRQTLFVGGTYHINRPEENLDLLARFDEADLNILQVLLKDLIHDVTGTLSGQAQLTGSLNNININGSGHLNRIGLTVTYLNTPYRADGPITMKNTVFLLDNMELLDPRGRKASVNGQIDLKQITNPHIQASIQAENFLVLNTTFRDNPLYYGTAYGTGQFDFLGRPNSMNININARTEESTIFNIPLNASGTLGDNEFIRFVAFAPADEPVNSGNPSDSAVDNSTERSSFLEGLLMNIDLHVTNGSVVNIQTDLGELSGRGDGQIALRISSLGDFEMFGDYLINSGKFTFTAQDFINKIFEIKQGGTIRWTGKPTDASLGLIAYYEQRTSLSPLYDAAGRTANEQRVIARAEMALNGNLLRPGINFSLDFPADPYVKDELQGYLSDVNNVNQQALSLIVRRSFIPGSNTDLGRELNSTLLSAGTELAFNQLNTIISQSLNLNFIDLNIRSLNDASASLRFFNDRLVFTGGITDLRNQRLNDLNVFSNERIATDAELLYLIRKDGRLVLRGSNRLNTRHFLLNPTDEYISALGLIYRQEFDTFEEFFNKLFLINRQRKTQPKPDEEDMQ